MLAPTSDHRPARRARLRAARALAWALLVQACGGGVEPGGDLGPGSFGVGGAGGSGTTPSAGAMGVQVTLTGGTSGAGGAGMAAAGVGAGDACSGDDCVVGCGNGKIDPGLAEACDDGNATSGDGCASDCKSVERDFACLQPGTPCISLVECGDGKVRGGEICDDGNTRDDDGCSESCALEEGWECRSAGSACAPRCGDARLIAREACDPPNVGAGCSADCRLEPGYACEPPQSPAELDPSRCHQTACGDKVREGSEACDDGNVTDGDGCSGACTLEPDCADGTCESICGDGIKLAPEECDDGNLSADDGCSPSCSVELGFICDDAASSPPVALNLAVTYRDFISFPSGGAQRHPDFQADWAGGDVTPGLMSATLDADGLPVLDGRCSDADPATILDIATCEYGQMATTLASAAAWYRDTPDVNRTVPGSLLLTRDAAGSYTFDSGGDGFYPVDGQGFLAPPAKETTEPADADVNDGLPHNFGFTTELRYFFQYLGGEALAFSGDDDLWVFVNRRLALDVGGLHPRTARTLDVDAVAATLGLVLGRVYEVALFHAERHAGASNFRLTLTGFAPTHSACEPTCGDGIVAASEQCDLGQGLNDGSYEGCTDDCQRGPQCGDGIVQAEEACDDGQNVTPYTSDGVTACAPGCVPSGYCGDGALDSLFGEECDPGDTPGAGCSADCRLGARCGDGIQQIELGEECDDGNTLSGDSCPHDCHPVVR